jgi:hypothetical protein
MRQKINGNLIRRYCGDRLIYASSYTTCIFTRTTNYVGIFNITKYSVSTTRQQNRILSEDLKGEDFIEMDDIPQNTDERGLLKAAADMVIKCVKQK